MFLKSSYSIIGKRALASTKLRSFNIPFLPTMPQKPSGVKGDSNSSSYVPPKNRAESNIHWDIERAFSAALLPLVAIPLYTGGQMAATADTLLGFVLLGHCYIGFQSCITDYISSRVYGKYHDYAMFILSTGTILSALGLYQLEKRGDGVVGTVVHLWKPLEVEQEVELPKQEIKPE